MIFRQVDGKWFRVDIVDTVATVLLPETLVVENDFDELELRDRVLKMSSGASMMALMFAPGISTKVINALRPLTDLLGAIAYPICYLGIGCGLILIMLGQKQRGMQFIKNAAIGYIGMQFLPVIMSILVEIADAMSAGGGVR